MHPLIALLGAAAACALVLARPPDGLSAEDPRALLGLLRGALGYMPPRYHQVPRYMELDEGHRRPEYENWLSREIDRLNFLDADEEMDPNYQPMEEPEEVAREGLYQALQERLATIKRHQVEAPNAAVPGAQPPKAVAPTHVNYNHEERKKEFALTPLDKGYYDIDNDYGGHAHTIQPMPVPLPIHRRDPLDAPFEVPRHTRQNPNLSKTKNLVAENLDKLRAGISHEEPSLGHPGHVHRVEGAPVQDPTDSIYGVAVIAAAGAALAVTAVVFAFGWYTISKKAKAAANVDYPAYGVTGPAADVTGDRKLAHSAHMYHYQHQKQQILAMERSGIEQRDGSVSDPESEEENEEGDYTVYECPGFATTGDMEVKNPMFSEEPTPATPGTCELVKPQPKE